MPTYPGDPPVGSIPRFRPDQLRALIERGVSPRAQRLRAYRSYYDGTQYVGRAPFLESKFGLPLRERAPCVVSDCVRSAARANAARCLGEGRFPTLTTLVDEDDSTFDERFGLSPDDSAIVDSLIRKIVDQADIHCASRIALETAQAVGTACSLQCIDASGQLAVQDLPAEWCTPTMDAAGEVTAVELSYRYVDSVRDPIRGDWFQVVREFRRYIDARQDATFYPRLVVSVEVGQQSEWRVEKQTAHDLGFCPIVWYPFLSPGASSIDIDGRPLHDNQLDNLDALNFALSQRHRGAFVCGEPQYTATGVAEDEIGGSRGRAASMSMPGVPGAVSFAPQQGNPAPAPTSSNPMGQPGNPGGRTGWMQSTHMPGSGGRLQRSPYTVWSAEEPSAAFGMLTMPGDALEPLNQDAKEILAQLRETFGVVFLDPATLSGTADISGKALLVMNERQVAFCDSVRRDFWRRWLRPVVCQFLRIALVKSGAGLYLGGAAKARPILQRFVQPVASPAGAGSDGAKTARWFDPYIEAHWGDYFPPTDLDVTNMVRNAISARRGRLITEKSAVESIASVFGIRDVSAYVTALHEDLEENPPIVVGMDAATFEQRSPADEAEKIEHDSAPNVLAAKEASKPVAKAGEEGE